MVAKRRMFFFWEGGRGGRPQVTNKRTGPRARLPYAHKSKPFPAPVVCGQDVKTQHENSAQQI